MPSSDERTTIASSSSSSAAINNDEYTNYGNRCGSLDENLIPQSPKIIYSSYSCDCKTCDPMAANSCCSKNKPVLKGYYEQQKSPKHIKSYSHHQSPRKSPNTSRQFVFEAVNPKEESSGKTNNKLVFLSFFPSSAK